MAKVMILYPFFNLLADYTLDNFWKNIFYNCSCNKFPRRASYDDVTKTLYIRMPATGGRTKIEQFKIPSSPEEAYVLLTNLFQQKLNIFSSSDYQHQNRELEKIKTENKVELDCEWKQLKPRSLKDPIIRDYISRISHEYELSAYEMRRLYAQLLTGFQLKYIDSDDIEYDNGVITAIYNCEFDESQKRFNFLRDTKIKQKTEKATTTCQTTSSLDRFIKEMNSLQRFKR
jgi:hypothetical protein